MFKPKVAIPEIIKKSTLKFVDPKKDSNSRIRHLKTILEHVDSDEAKSLFETNYSHVYYILHDTFVQAENNLRQRVHKAHREELDGSLWLLGKILCLLPELVARRWQCHSISRVLAKLMHHGNSTKLRKEGVRYFLMWYQTLAENAPQEVHSMFNDLVPGLTIPTKSKSGPHSPSSDLDFTNTTDFSNHPNLRGELGGSVFHDTGVHPVKPPDITPLLPPASNERTAAPDPKDGLEILLDCMVQSTGCLKWRDNNIQRHMKCFHFLLQRFREVYLPVFSPNFDHSTSVYEPKLDLPVMRAISKKEEVMSPCVVVLVNWISKYTNEKTLLQKIEQHHIFLDNDDLSGESASLMSNLRHIGYTQAQIVRDVLYSTRDTINFVHEVYRQAFLLNYTSKSQIDAMRIAISIYRDWMSNSSPPPFLLEPNEDYTNGSNPSSLESTGSAGPRGQRLRADSYLGAITKENLLIRSGMQNVLQVFVTNAVNVFMVQTGHLNIRFNSKSKEDGATPLDEQTDICKRVLNIYRTMVMKTRMEAKTWEQLLMVLLQITSVILAQAPPNAKKNNLGGRLAQPIFQTLIVTWIRAHTNVVVHPQMWERFLKVLTTLTHREELIIEWDKTVTTLTRVLARQVYNLNLQDLPLDRLAEQKGKRRRVGIPTAASVWQNVGQSGPQSTISNNSKVEESQTDSRMSGKPSHHSHFRHIPGTPTLNRSYSEGSLATPYRKSRSKRRIKGPQVQELPPNVESTISKLLANTSTQLSVSMETLNITRLSQSGESAAVVRRTQSLDSVRLKNEDCESLRSRSPSPTASSGIEGGSIKDSPLQIDVLGGDSSSLETQDGNSSQSADRRSILGGGNAKGWLPDVAAVMWKRMLGALGDVNKILNPKLHAEVFKYLIQMTESLIKIKMNQGISTDNQSTPQPPALTPPIGICLPWCFGSLALDQQYNQGKLYAMQLLCTIAKNSALTSEHLPLFYQALHQALTGEDRSMAFTALRYLGGPRFLSLLLPGHSLLLLDFVHASTVVLTSSDTRSTTPRAEVSGLLGSLLCFPKTALPVPVLQPAAPHIDLMECPDLQEHVLNIVLRCARREPTARARTIAIASLGQWILKNLTSPASDDLYTGKSNKINSKGFQAHPRTPEAFQVILQALQFKHRIIARAACETLRLCAERGNEVSEISGLASMIIQSMCASLEIQNIPNPKDADKHLLTSCMLCLGEWCMALPVRVLTAPLNDDPKDTLLLRVFKVLHGIATGRQVDRVKYFMTDEDFDMNIVVDDIKEDSNSEPNYQTQETIQQCITSIQICSKTIIMHLVTNISHFPLGIGATRLSSMVDEQDDLSLGTLQRENSSGNRDGEICANQVLNAPNLQLFMLSNELVASFIELPTLRMPGGGITAGLVAANKQVRVLLRDLNGKYCWDVSIIYKEPKLPSLQQQSVQQTKDETDMDSSSLDRPHTFLTVGALGSKTFGGSNLMLGSAVDPMMSMITSVGMMAPQAPRHTLRHRPPNQLPTANDMAPDLDQLDDLLQYIGHTSPECLEVSGASLNSPGPSPLGANFEAQTISILLNQRAMEQDYVLRRNQQAVFDSSSTGDSMNTSSMEYSSYSDEVTIRSSGNTTNITIGDNSSSNRSGNFNQSEKFNLTNGNKSQRTSTFQFGRLLFSQIGLAGWERRKRTNLLSRTDKLLRELRNLDAQKCRETHKVAVIYVANGQEDKNSILRNSAGSSTYEMFVSALGWEVELESHNGFLGGLPRQGCGQSAPYFATPFLEVIYHVSTRIPSDSPEAILNKTRHLGNDEVHIVWSEHYRDYRRDILPTEFCDVLIVIYPLRSGLFRVTVNKKPDVPWFGPISDEMVIGGANLASLVRATAINASRAKRTSLPFYQQYYEERNRSLDSVSSRHKERSTYEDFIARVFSPISNSHQIVSASATATSSSTAAALIDHQHSSRSSIKHNWLQHLHLQGHTSDSSHHISGYHHLLSSLTSISLDHPSPRPFRKMHPFKNVPKKSNSSIVIAPPHLSPTLPSRRLK